MGPGILAADHATLCEVVADLALAADRLRADRARADRAVDALLAGWTGAAATSYAAGWSEWRAGADRVLDGLVTMRRLLDVLASDLVRVDATAGDDLGRLSARLG